MCGPTIAGKRAFRISTSSAASATLKAAEARLAELKAQAADAASRAEEIALNLAELDALDPREDEETELAGERAILGSAEKALSDLADARIQLGGDKLSQKLGSALRAVEHARQRAGQAGAEGDHPVIVRLSAAVEAIDRTMVEAAEAIAAVDAAADATEPRCARRSVSFNALSTSCQPRCNRPR